MPEPLGAEHGEQPSCSQSFLVRVWLEILGDGNTEWRGKVQCISTGEAHYFRDWAALVTSLEGMLSPAAPPAALLSGPEAAAGPPSSLPSRSDAVQ